MPGSGSSTLQNMKVDGYLFWKIYLMDWCAVAGQDNSRTRYHHCDIFACAGYTTQPSDKKKLRSYGNLNSISGPAGYSARYSVSRKIVQSITGQTGCPCNLISGLSVNVKV